MPALIVAVLVMVSCPLWLPRCVIALRMRIFGWINGDEGIRVPGDLVDIAQFRQVYGHPGANGRSRGAMLSDLFWYWLSPGAHLHQEHLEPGERYDEVARTTRRFLGVSRGEAEELTARCANRVLDRLGRPRLVRLRDAMMPVFAEFYYEIVFGEPCPARARELIVANADDVVTALKCCGLRHMGKRDRLTRFLIERVKAGEVVRPLPAALSVREGALYLQGTFFNTAVVQSAEAMAHLLMVLASHVELQTQIADGLDERILDRVMEETFRLYPLFGIAHRITSTDIPLPRSQGALGDPDETGCPAAPRTIPAGSVLCFDYPAFHRAGFDRPDSFDPDRWRGVVIREANHIPFGMAANRPCPAWRLAPITMRVVAREVLRRHRVRTAAAHSRSLPNRGPVVLLPRDTAARPGAGITLSCWLALLWLRDRWEDVYRSVVQLIFGSFMVWHARQLRLCTRYFESARPTSFTGVET